MKHKLYTIKWNKGLKRQSTRKRVLGKRIKYANRKIKLPRWSSHYVIPISRTMLYLAPIQG